MPDSKPIDAAEQTLAPERSAGRPLRRAAWLLTRFWPLWLFGWLAAAAVLRLAAPEWASVVKDGDFEFLPEGSPSRVGQRMLREAFPEELSRSQMVLVFTTVASEFTPAEQCTLLDVARRLSYSTAAAKWERLRLTDSSLGPAAVREVASSGQTSAEAVSLELVRLQHLLDAAVDFDQQRLDMVARLAAAADGAKTQPAGDRLWKVYSLRAAVSNAAGNRELLEGDLRLLEARPAEASPEGGPQLLDVGAAARIEDLWTWADPVLAHKLGGGRPNARLLSVQIRDEFMAVQNVALFESLRRVVEDCREATDALIGDDAASAMAGADGAMRVELTGPAAVGADLLRASRAGVERSEMYAVIAVVATLLLIYRSPLLVFLPLLTIGVALSVASSLLASVAAASQPGGALAGWLELYATTRVFLVVLIFGIGTDLTLFLVVRCRENYAAAPAGEPWRRAIARGWLAVFGAVVGSGLTTAIGLSMMSAASFAKFHYSGVAIAAALLVTLAVCLTLPPAALSGLGPIAFWPQRKKAALPSGPAPGAATGRRGAWGVLADAIVRRPATVLAAVLLAMAAPATAGWLAQDTVTYDLVSELGGEATSRQGQQLVKEYFPGTETSSITLCVVAPDDFADPRELAAAIEAYRRELFVPGVRGVAALTDPLGEFPPDRSMGLLSQDAWRRRMLQNHPLTRQKFLSQTAELSLRAARFEVVTEHDPFSPAAAGVLAAVRERAAAIGSRPGGEWVGSRAGVSGTAAGIEDLRLVTQRDETLVQSLVVLAVFCVLLALTRRVELSAYLMFSVLLSYLVTLGVAHWAFRWTYGEQYSGLDWKVPLFLFVILVAVGQDYNIYLTTRVLEEQRRRGPAAGLREAIVSTGGIITSCGLIMFATFAAMWAGGAGGDAVAGTLWPTPSLRGISELGFALSFGILLDTFVVRTVLVPAYIAWRQIR